MFNLTLKDKAATDVVYKAMNGATANSPAIWVNTNAVPALSRQVAFSATRNKSGTARKLRITMVNPSVNALCEDACEIHNIPVTLELTFPNVVSQDDRNDAVSLLASLLNDSTFQAAVEDAYAPA